jgi:hypothetical protein
MFAYALYLQHALTLAMNTEDKHVHWYGVNMLISDARLCDELTYCIAFF